MSKRIPVGTSDKTTHSGFTKLLFLLLLDFFPFESGMNLFLRVGEGHKLRTWCFVIHFLRLSLQPMHQTRGGRKWWVRSLSRYNFGPIDPEVSLRGPKLRHPGIDPSTVLWYLFWCSLEPCSCPRQWFYTTVCYVKWKTSCLLSHLYCPLSYKHIK